MRFIVMHKTNAHWESGAIPEAGLIAKVSKLVSEMADAGVLRSGEGLRASSQGVRLRFSGGRRSVVQGPFKASNEASAGFAILKLESIEQAIEWGSRAARALRCAEIDIRPVTEPWDIGLGPKPEGLKTRRFMLMYGARRASKPGAPGRAGMGKLIAEMTSAGVLLQAEGFEPSSAGARLNFSGGKRTMTDGPFTESKELIAGYVILEAAKQEALRWALRYGETVGAEEVDVLPLSERSARKPGHRQPRADPR